jgi:hypothetical protein
MLPVQHMKKQPELVQKNDINGPQRQLQKPAANAYAGISLVITRRFPD